MAHTLSMPKTNAGAWRSNKSAVGSPLGHHSRMVRSPITQYELHGRIPGSLCKPQRLNGVLWDVISSSTRRQRSANAMNA